MVDQFGENYEGNVNVLVSFLNSTLDSHIRSMPNAYQGVIDGQDVYFESFNAIYFDIREQSGRPLYIKEGSQVNMGFPLNSNADLGK